MKRLLVSSLALLPLLLALSACDYLGIDDPAKIAATKTADAKAVGGACRNARRAIEDCYVLNPKADKAAVLAGWQEMDQYMRDNKLDGILPMIANVASAPSSGDADNNDSSDASAMSKTDAQAGSKPDAKSDSKTSKSDKSDKKAR